MPIPKTHVHPTTQQHILTRSNRLKIHMSQEQMHYITPHIQTFRLKTRNKSAPITASQLETKLNTTKSIHFNSKQTIDSKPKTSMTQKPQFECNYTHSI